jgi:hypothetical protein
MCNGHIELIEVEQEPKECVITGYWNYTRKDIKQL